MRVELRKKDSTKEADDVGLYTQKHMVVNFTLIFMELKKQEKL